MKCTDNSRRRRMRARRRRRKKILRLMILLLLCLCVGTGYLICSKIVRKEHLAADYAQEHYNASVYKGELFAEDLCVVTENVTGSVSEDTDLKTDSLTSAALFNVTDATADYAYNVHEELYPASVTKIMTALLALENADISETVTVQVGAEDFAADESVAGIKKGDQMTLEALLYGLLLDSGNDCAESIAYYIAGDKDKFADMMNERAAELMATKTHFTNPSGLHDSLHYTTAYDIYLIFNACIKNETFVKIIQTASYQADITGADGVKRQITWTPSHYYAQNKAEKPENAEIVGGKTGTTSNAGNCLVLLDQSEDGEPYISIVMGAESKDLLYQDMTALIQEIPESGSE